MRLNNKLNRKRIDYIKIQGTCDKNGRIKQQFTDVMIYDDEYDYYGTLTSMQCSSLFSNIVKDKTYKFYYLENDVLKTLTFTEGAYKIWDINVNLQLKLPNESIKLIVDQGTGRCRIFLKQGYKIDFTHNDTFRDILGFDAVILDQAFTYSYKICDVGISTNIYIYLNIIKGFIFQGKSSDIIYSFPNNIAFGHLINLYIRQEREHLLMKKYFSDFTEYFTDQNNMPIDFMQSIITLTFEIRQVWLNKLLAVKQL